MEDATKTEEKKDLYTKEQILKSEKFNKRQDILGVLLDDGTAYAMDDVETRLENFMKGVVS